MKIQNLLLPEVGVCTESDLFYRTENGTGVEFDADDKALVFTHKGQKCDFATYFNGLSVEKWKKYTEIGDIYLVLFLKGRFNVTLHTNCRVGDEVSRNIVKDVRAEGDGTTPIKLPYSLYEFKGMAAFSLKALEDGAAFYGGWYDADCDEDKLNQVDLAINICTFKREPFVIRNMSILNENILCNKDHELFNHLQVFISDNGKTLPAEQLSNKKIHIVSNKNTGGSGGFSRGMMEILESRAFHATHIIMMDDDVVITTESLFRTYMLLRCRKERYSDMFIGGAMLRLDNRTMQVESGASWNAGKLVSNKANIDLSVLENCLYNEIEEYTEYNAWWYCCVPMSSVNSTNLPLPIFIRGDDLEYGLRNMKTLVLLNGICVWHEPFENKYSSFLQYYIIRNMLYVNAVHFNEFGKYRFLKRLWFNAMREIVYYRYKNVELMVRGVQDYYRGIDFLLNTDGERLHKEIMSFGYKAKPIEELDYAFHYPDYDNSVNQIDKTPLHKLLRYVTINGYLLPAKKQTGKTAKCVPTALCRPINFYRQNNVLNYDEASGKAFMTKKSYMQFFRCIALLIKTTTETIFKYDKKGREFRDNCKKVQNDVFWNSYLR